MVKFRVTSAQWRDAKFWLGSADNVLGDQFSLPDPFDGSGSRAQAELGRTEPRAHPLGLRSDTANANTRPSVVDPTQDNIFAETAPSCGALGESLWQDDTSLTLADVSVKACLPCMCSATRIKTARGELALGEVTTGDLVLTRDNGYQPVRWTCRASYSPDALKRMPDLRPVQIKAGALGEEMPENDMVVSPRHRIAMARIEGQKVVEVLVPARKLTSLPGIRRITPPCGVAYGNILFDRHELVMSDGTWTESFQPAVPALAALDAAQRDDLFELFPALKQAKGRKVYGTARPMLKD